MKPKNMKTFEQHSLEPKTSDIDDGLIKESWRVIDMEELYDYINKDSEQTMFIKPKFPTRRWGNIYTKTSTTDIKQLNTVLRKLRDDGFDVRKKLEKDNNLGKFYKIEINNHPNRIVN